MNWTTYIHFLVAAQKIFTCTTCTTCTEAARCHQGGAAAPSHDTFTRLLSRQPPDPEALWRESGRFVGKKGGLLILDDTTLDKPCAKKMDLVRYHWSGKHHDVCSKGYQPGHPALVRWGSTGADRLSAV